MIAVTTSPVCAYCGEEANPPSREDLEQLGFVDPTQASHISRRWPDGSRDFFCTFNHYFAFKEEHPEKGVLLKEG